MAKRILVVCYSRGGTTLRVAEHVAKATGADIDRIEDPRPRKGVVGYLASGLEAVAKGLPTIETHEDPRDYDLVVLGSPVWAGTLSSPVRSYLLQHARHIRSPAFFAVMGGVGGDNVVREMQLICRARTAPTCVFKEQDIKRDRYQGTCEPFVQAIQRAAEAAPQATTNVQSRPGDAAARGTRHAARHP